MPTSELLRERDDLAFLAPPSPRARPHRLDRARAAAAVRELLEAIGENPNRTELLRTPERVVEACAELLSGIGTDPADELRNRLPAGNAAGELVLLRDIAFRSVCEHHLLPFHGRAHIAYRPGDRIVGFSALARVVETAAARLQMQERLGEEIATAIDTALEPAGVFVALEAAHGCLSDRGARQTAATAFTVASRGTLARAAERAELFAVLGALPPGGEDPPRL